MLEFVIELLDDNEDRSSDFNSSDVIKHLTLLRAIYFMHSSIKEISNSVLTVLKNVALLSILSKMGITMI
jgi:hypothetical protein